jgi:hypothetical protein
MDRVTAETAELSQCDGVMDRITFALAVTAKPLTV